MIGTLDIKVAAHNPNFPLEPVFTFINSAQSFRIRNVPRAIGKWNITKVFIHLNYPDNTTVQKECVLNGNIWIGTVEGCATSGTSTNGFYVTASGIDENENVITNYVLGAGDLYVKDLDGTIEPAHNGEKMYFNDTIPTNPKKGDATFIDGVLNVYDGTNWTPVADDPDLSNYYTKAEVDEAIGEVEESIPTKTSDLTNDSGFITAAQVPTPSYIEDADGLKIEADLDCTVKDLTLPWTLADGADTYTLNYAEQSGKWLYEEAETKKIELAYTAENSLWELAFYIWNNGEWQYNTGSTTTQEEDATSLYILDWSLTRSILSNDKLVTQSEMAVKRDLSDMTVKGVPQNTNSQSWFTIKYGTTTENAWYYDEGRWESGQTLRVLAVPATIYTLQKLQESQWTNIGEFTLDNNAEATITYEGVTYSITGYVGEIVTSNQLTSQIAALEARIAALENNNQ